MAKDELESDPAKYRVYWFASVPGTPFYVPVYTLPEAKKILTTLADYDLHLEKQGLVGKHGNAGGLEVLNDGAWEEWSDKDGNTIDDYEWEVKVRGKDKRHT